MICKKCGQENPDSQMFCFVCASPLFGEGRKSGDAPYSAQTYSDRTFADRPHSGGYAGVSSFGTASGPAGGVAAAVAPRCDRRFLRFLARRWYLIALPLALLLACALFLDTLLLAISPSLAVSYAARNTLSALDKRAEGSPLILFNTLADCLKDGKIYTEFSYEDDLTGDYSADALFLCGGNAKNYGALTSLTYGGKTTELEFYLNRERVAFKTPWTGDSCYGITFGTFDRDIDAFADASGLDGTSVAAFTNIVNALKTAMAPQNDAVSLKSSELVTQFVRSLKPAASRGEITVNGESMRCAVVEYELTDTDVKKLISDLYDDYEQKQQLAVPAFDLRSFLEGYQAGLGAADGSGTPGDALDSFIDEFTATYKGSAFVSFYINHGTFVRCALSFPDMSLGEGTASVTADLGENPREDALSLIFSESHEGLDLTFLTVTMDTDDTPLNNTNTVTVTADSDVSTVKADWDKRTGDLLLSLLGPGVSWNARGTLMAANYSFRLEFPDLLGGENHLMVIISAEKGVSVPAPAYVNLDHWGGNFFGNIQLGGSGYSFL